MKFKALSVFGFKTFAEQTKLTFESGITAIVGPNGSGKSNLVDAIRWVLGEQSSKSLRSTRMEDVIFAGNDKRKPLGMVEVALTFDNDEGKLPIEFREVQITRRAYRAGEIEYYINRNHVRLRDVMDLLMGTGLGPGSYAIVSQGQIDSILSSKPTERRSLFEETAGINRFLSRKAEAMRRLEQTEQNGIRANDLIAELERRIPELDTQVRRAKRYRRVSARVRDLEILAYLRASTSRREERERVRGELDAAEASRTAAGARAAGLAAERSSLRSRLYQHELALEERRTAAQSARSDLARLESDHAAAVGRREALDAQSSATSVDRERVAAERAALVARLAELDEKRAPLRQELEERRQRERDALTDVAHARENLDHIFTALRELEAGVAQQAASAAERRAQLQGLQAELERLEDEAARSVAEMQELADLRARKTVEAHEASEARAVLERRLADAKRVVAEADERCTAAAAERGRLQAEYRDATSEIAGAESRLHTIEELEATLEGHVPGTRAVVEAWQSGEIRGVRGVVSNLISVEERYARALDVAFAAGLSNIVTETSEDAERAIAFLTTHERGRATFLPLDTLADRRGRELGEYAAQPGVIGYAHTLVQADPAYAGVVAFLVGRILVVESLSVGIALVRESGLRDTVVTLAGEQILGGGAITGGRHKRERSILSRRAQAQHLREALPEMRSRLGAVERELHRRELEFETAGSERDRLRTEQNEGELALRDALSREAAIQQELARIATDIERVAEHGESARRAAAEVAHRAAALAAIPAGSESGDRRRAELERQLDEARTAIAVAERIAGELAAQVGSLRETLAAHAAERDATQTRLEILDADRERAAEARAGMERELAELAAQIETFAVAIGERRETVAAGERILEAQRTEREAMAGRINELDGEVQLAENDERERASLAERSRRRVAEIEAELGMLAATFAQNPATEAECDDVETRYAGETGAVADDLPRLREELARLVNVNLNAEADREELAQREAFLREQLDDLTKARETLLQVIREIELSCQTVFNETFDAVRIAFADVFARLFPGGEAKMWQTNPESLSETGIEISVQPPGKKMTALAALSGGERAMTAAALIFALIKVKPSPFYLLDEVDAALDDQNVERFSDMVREVAANAQLIIVTHNKKTMELADRLYGVTMAEPGVSTIVSAALSEEVRTELEQALSEPAAAALV